MEVHSTEEMYREAAQFVSTLQRGEQATTVTLSGDLGAGKTTFVQGTLRALGVTEHITSPTFVIQKSYELTGQIFARAIHIDAYRLKNEHELEVLGWEELAANPENLIFIEWPEKVSGLLAQSTHSLRFEYKDENTRSIFW